MKPKIYYDKDTDTLSIWNGIPASEAEDVAEHLVADFNDEGEVVGFTLEHAADLLRTPLLGGRSKRDEIQHAFIDLRQCRREIRRAFSKVDESILDEVLGAYNSKSLRRRIRKFGDGYTLRSLPKKVDRIQSADVLVIVVMNSPKLDNNSRINPSTPLHKIPYWRNDKGLKPYAVVNRQKFNLNFVVWEQECPVHGDTTPNARKSHSLLVKRYPRLHTAFQVERQISERFLLLYKDLYVNQGNLVIILTNAAKNKKSFGPPISQILESSHVKHIPTKLYGSNRKIMKRISCAISHFHN